MAKTSVDIDMEKLDKVWGSSEPSPSGRPSAPRSAR